MGFWEKAISFCKFYEKCNIILKKIFTKLDLKMYSFLLLFLGKSHPFKPREMDSQAKLISWPFYEMTWNSNKNAQLWPSQDLSADIFKQKYFFLRMDRYSRYLPNPLRANSNLRPLVHPITLYVAYLYLSTKLKKHFSILFPISPAQLPLRPSPYMRVRRSQFLMRNYEDKKIGRLS